jgi:hypothetical protein
MPDFGADRGISNKGAGRTGPRRSTDPPVQTLTCGLPMGGRGVAAAVLCRVGARNHRRAEE